MLKITNGLSERLGKILIKIKIRGRPELISFYLYLRRSPKFGPVLSKLIQAYGQEEITYQELAEELCKMANQQFSEQEKKKLHNLILQQIQTA